MRWAANGRRWRLALPILVLMASGVAAETLTYEHEGRALFSIDVPDDWVADLDFAQEAREAGVPEGEEPEFRIVEISPGDGDHVWFGIWALPAVGSIDEGTEYLSSLRQDLFTALEIERPEDVTIAGMQARTIRGTAEREGERVELAMALFEPRPGAVVAVLYVGEPDAWEENREVLDAMVDSLRPANG